MNKDEQRTTPVVTEEATRLVIAYLIRAVAEQLKLLLETKHLYQRVSVEAERIVTEVRGRVADNKVYLDPFDESTRQLLYQRPLIPARQALFLLDRSGGTPPVLTLLIQNVKVFCSNCDDRETFSPIWWTDATNEIRKPHVREVMSVPEVSEPRADLQIFLLVYQCQHCMGPPLAFLVRREGWQLMLDGRSPMEHVEVPPFIPKAERHLFRDALVAMHGGKTLGALFYLRTFIEQFARRQTGLRGKKTGDEIMAAYSDTLPSQQRDQMPSLRHWYDRLSEPLHEARGDAALFEEARVDIEKHFDIRRVFQIPEKTPAPVSKQ